MTPHLFVLPAQPTELADRAWQRLCAEAAGHPSALDPDEFDEPDPCPPTGIARPDLRIVR